MRRAILFVVVACSGWAAARSGQEPARPDLEKAAAQIVRETNELRQAEKLAKLTVSEKLTETAQDFADFMARTGKYGHAADGKQPSECAAAHGYDYCVVAENIAYQSDPEGFTTEALAGAFFEGWKDSPEHRRNMLDPAVTETGVAVARGEESGYYYAVQLFGRPKSQAITFAVANRSDGEIRYRVGEEEFSLARFTRTHNVCRPSDLTFLNPGGEGAEAKVLKTVRPESGDAYVVTDDGEGGLAVRKRKSPE